MPAGSWLLFSYLQEETGSQCFAFIPLNVCRGLWRSHLTLYKPGKGYLCFLHSLLLLLKLQLINCLRIPDKGPKSLKPRSPGHGTTSMTPVASRLPHR